MTEDYNAILACYKSGQMSEKQWQSHLSDKLFVIWLNRKEERVK